MTNRRSLRPIMFVLLIIAVVIAACRCSPSIALDCATETAIYGLDGLRSYGFMDCANAVSDACPDALSGDPAAAAAEAACIETSVSLWKQGQPLPTPGGYPYNGALADAFANSGANNFAGPQNPVGGQNQAPQPVNCAPFSLRAPTDGLANGINTFIWFPPEPSVGLTYRLLFLAENGQLLYSFLSSHVDFAQPDISQQVIGGAYQITVRIEALNAAGAVVCTIERGYLREASNPGQPQQAGATPTYYETPQQPPR